MSTMNIFDVEKNKSRLEYNEFLEGLVKFLDITPEQFDKVREHYKEIATWLGQDDSELSKYDPQLYYQGSFRLGTVIRPISDKDEFDIDLVCKLNMKVSEVTQKELKQLVGNRLKKKPKYQLMLKEEKRRCWALDFNENLRFHMDILPAIAHETSKTKEALSITDIEHKNHSTISDDWPLSNPIDYAKWFKKRMEVQFDSALKLLAKERSMSIEKISEMEVRTPLQRAIQILKRHRDMMFGDDEDRPISIIITTLAAKAYSNEENIYEALKNILAKMSSYILIENGYKVVRSEVYPFENFADKWQDYPEREENFYNWLEKAQNDIIGIVHST